MLNILYVCLRFRGTTIPRSLTLTCIIIFLLCHPKVVRQNFYESVRVEWLQHLIWIARSVQLIILDMQFTIKEETYFI